MMDDKALEEKAREIARVFNFVPNKTNLAPILAALREVAAEARQEEHAEWLAKSASVADTAKAAFERGREEERKALRERARLGYELSFFAAAIRWDRSKNTQEWMDGLRERIEAVQSLGKGAAKGSKGPPAQGGDALEQEARAKKAEAEVERLRGLLDQYAQHDNGCTALWRGGMCECGLDEASGTPPDPVWEGGEEQRGHSQCPELAEKP